MQTSNEVISFHLNVHYIHTNNDQPSGRKRGREDEQSDDTEDNDESRDVSVVHKKDSRARKHRKGTDMELGQAAPVEAPQSVNNTRMKARTEQGDRERPMVTAAIADVKEMAIDDMADSRSPDPGGDEEEDEEVRGDSGAEGEPVGVNVSRTVP